LQNSFIDRQRSVAQWVSERKIANITNIDALMRDYVEPSLIRKVAPTDTDY
jgi:hypothetical protein